MRRLPVAGRAATGWVGARAVAGVSLSGSFRSLVVRTVSHGRPRVDDLEHELASSEPLIAQASRLLEDGSLTLTELERGLRAPEGDAERERVERLLRAR